MPSPFAGMDPYLEGSLWTSFHALFIPEVVRLLNPQLRPRYIALPQQYQQMSTGEEIGITPNPIYPDVGVSRAGLTPVSTSAAVAGSAVAPLEMRLVMPFPVPHHYVEIRDLAQRRLVTVIELLSPTNKSGLGRKRYQRKRQRILQSSAHLLEVDLLRKGKRMAVEGTLPPDPYFVFLSRVERRPGVQVYPIPANRPLPAVPVPLEEKDPDVVLDLQQAFTAAYDLGGFSDLVDYRKDSPVPLTAEEKRMLAERV